MLSHEQRSLLSICDRLMNSRNEAERRSIYEGLHYECGYPVLLDTDLLFEHKHIIGPPGTGKTSLGLLNDNLQLIYRNDGPVIIFDCKGDLGLFHAIRMAAEYTGRTFKWFTNKPFYSTYVFNPWDNRLLQRLTLPDILGLFMQSLNQDHGPGYGRSWFRDLSRTLLRRGILETIPQKSTLLSRCHDPDNQLFPKYPPIHSFRDLHAILNDLADDNEELRAARHLVYIAESLADFEQLNYVPNRAPNDPKVTHAIYMPEVIREKQIVYFYLVGAMDVSSVAAIAKLALYSLLMAATAYEDEYGKPARIYTSWDEAQVLIAKNIENVLAQARSHGLSCILAHQSMSQLNPPGGPDLRELVWSCTATKEVFGARDPWLLHYISNTSGTTRYFNHKYSVPAQNIINGQIGLPYCCSDRDGITRVQIEEYTGPRLTYQDIMDIGQHPNLSLMWISRLTGLSAFRGWFPVYKPWPISKTEHKSHLRTRWPAGTEETLEMKSIWPRENDYTIVPQHHPALAETPQEIDVSDKLRAIRKKLFER